MGVAADEVDVSGRQTGTSEHLMHLMCTRWFHTVHPHPRPAARFPWLINLPFSGERELLTRICQNKTEQRQPPMVQTEELALGHKNYVLKLPYIGWPKAWQLTAQPMPWPLAMNANERTQQTVGVPGHTGGVPCLDVQ